MTEFEKQVLEDLAELKTNMRWVTGGDSHPGRLQELEEQVERHEQVLQRARGVAAALACLLTMVHLGFEYLRMRWGR
jgi:hypothetical protein